MTRSPAGKRSGSPRPPPPRRCRGAGSHRSCPCGRTAGRLSRRCARAPSGGRAPPGAPGRRPTRHRSGPSARPPGPPGVSRRPACRCVPSSSPSHLPLLVGCVRLGDVCPLAPGGSRSRHARHPGGHLARHMPDPRQGRGCVPYRPRAPAPYPGPTEPCPPARQSLRRSPPPHGSSPPEDRPPDPGGSRQDRERKAAGQRP